MGVQKIQSGKSNAIFLQRRLGGLVECWVLDDSYHLITIDRQRDVVMNRTADFVSFVERYAVRQQPELARSRPTLVAGREHPAPLQPDVQTWARWIWIKPQSDTPEPHHMTFAGNHGLAGVAAASDGSLLAVGHVDQTGLLARFNPDATSGWKIALSPPTSGISELLAVAAVAVQQPTWIAVGWA